MGYFTYRIFRGISADSLHEKLVGYGSLFDSAAIPKKLSVSLLAGSQCSALRLGYLHSEETLLQPLGHMFGCVWMDVRYQDGDAWDLSAYRGAEHLVTHRVNPWASGDPVSYNPRHIESRIGKICNLWPEVGEVLRPYLLPWRVPVKRFGFTILRPRLGKAYPGDRAGYGSADQIHDFVARLGITVAENGLETAWPA